MNCELSMDSTALFLFCRAGSTALFYLGRAGSTALFYLGRAGSTALMCGYSKQKPPLPCKWVAVVFCGFYRYREKSPDSQLGDSGG